jgi:hypothetical protein
LVAIVSLLSVETFSARHRASMLGKNPMNVAALLAEHGSRPRVEVTQRFKVLGPHIDARKRSCEFRPLLSGNVPVVTAHGLEDL